MKISDGVLVFLVVILFASMAASTMDVAAEDLGVNLAKRVSKVKISRRMEQDYMHNNLTVFFSCLISSRNTSILGFLKQSALVPVNTDAPRQPTRSLACSFVSNAASSAGVCLQGPMHTRRQKELSIQNEMMEPELCTSSIDLGTEIREPVSLPSGIGS
ncbi:hypothetical protein ZIOFF_023888 [Zingiber officinale]|uniref:Uncharacterized protein n=1 Tax=Zingiber officinale TaxID=94328 RepID=A0A8J5LD45_ZINOF|nr:hypothetical protein ZIOFF_023888 [Zingiber officinale]